MSPKSQQAADFLELNRESDNGVHQGSDSETDPVLVYRTRLLWDGRRFLGRCVGAGSVFFVILAFVIPPKYESGTRLMPPEDNSGGLGLLSALTSTVSSSSSPGSESDTSSSPIADISNTILGGKSTGALFIGVLRSETVENALIQRFDLRKVYRLRTWADTRKELEGRTAITEDRKSKIIEIKVRDRSRERAQAMARSYVEELNRAVNSLSTSSARREREFLEARLVAVKQDLDQASQNFSKFASQNTAIDVPEQGKAMVQAAAVLQGELIAAESEEQGLKQIYTEQNVRVRSLDGRIEELRRKLKDVGSAGTGADPDSEDENALYPSIRKLPLLGVTYFDLYRKVKIQEAVFETLTKRYEMAKVEEAKEIPTIRELDPADLPEKKISPPRTQIVLSGLIFSLVVGCCFILGNDKWRRLDSQDPRKVLTVQIAGDLRDAWAHLHSWMSKAVRKKETSAQDFD